MWHADLLEGFMKSDHPGEDSLSIHSLPEWPPRGVRVQRAEHGERPTGSFRPSG